MALSAAVQGAKRPSQIVTWTESDGDAVDLSDATVTGRLRHAQTGAARAVAGALTVTDGAAGVFRWDYADADVAEAGVFEAQFTATWASGVSPARTLAATWVVHGAI